MENPSNDMRNGLHTAPNCDERNITINGPSANIALRNNIPTVDFEIGVALAACPVAGFHVAARNAPPKSNSVQARSRNDPEGVSCTYCAYSVACPTVQYTARKMANLW